MRIRIATPEDAPALLGVYAPYVRKTAITYEWEVPSEAEFRERVGRTLARYPYLVAEETAAPASPSEPAALPVSPAPPAPAAPARILGYAYAGPLHERRAYDWAVETSIYLAPDARGRGLGRALYDALEGALRAQGVVLAAACIAHPEVEDEYLTRNSEGFHAHMGYRMVGCFHGCACKFGRWYGMCWMEKDLAPRPAGEPSPFRPFPEVRDAVAASLEEAGAHAGQA